MFHGSMQGRCKEETNTDFLDAVFHLLWSYIQIDTECFKDIGTTTGR